MQRSVEFNINPGVLRTETCKSPRFVPTPTFVAFDPFAGQDEIALPIHQAERLAYLLVDSPRAVVRPLTDRIVGLAARIENQRQLRELETALPDDRQSLRDAENTLMEVGDQLRAAISTSDSVGISQVTTRLGELASALVAAQAAPSLASQPPTAVVQPQPRTQPDDRVSATALSTSELGFLFLDRTRIEPLGFALGEHLYSLSLAPGEEVTIEQRTFSKREKTFEQASEQELTVDSEMSSTLTTELSEGMSRERSSTQNASDTTGVNVGGSIDGISFNIVPSSASSVQDANRTAATESLKTTQVAASKVASRNRRQHKTIFRLTSESRFEASNKRTIRNPNIATPIDLVYFKILERLQLSQERYGVRLCWSPAVYDPASAFFLRLQPVRDDIYRRAASASAGPRPERQQVLGAVPGGLQPSMISESTSADKFDPLWGGQKHDYSLVLSPPSGYEWDGAPLALATEFSGSRPSWARILTTNRTGPSVSCVVHVGVEDCRNPFKSQYWEAIGNFRFTVSARFVPLATNGTDPRDKANESTWNAQIAAWEIADRQAKHDARVAADEEWVNYSNEVLAKTSILDEVMGSLLQSMFNGRRPRTLGEVDRWQELFDWKNAGIRLYPSWWSDRESRDSSRPSADFVNASWARLYLPIRLGYEADALRWIYDRKSVGRAGALVERMITRTTRELRTYRTTTFGGEDEIVLSDPLDGCRRIVENYQCLGRWEETVPTDGTHLEILVGTSSSSDVYSSEQLSTDQSVRREQALRIGLENRLLGELPQMWTDDASAIQTQVRVQVGHDQTRPV